MEIIVADSGSGDETESVCRDYASRVRVRFVAVPTRSRAQGLNFAIRHAQGQFVCRIDGRSIVPADYIERLHRLALETGADVVGGIQRAVVSGENYWQDAIAIAMNSVCGAGPAPHRTALRSGPVDNIYLGIYRKEVFDRVGYFDETSPIISEEVDLHYRIMTSGGTVWLDHTMIVEYEPRSNVLDQMRLYFRYGGAKSAFIRKYGKVITVRQLIAPGFYLIFFAAIVATPFISGASWLAVALLTLYSVAIISCTTMACMRAARITLVAPTTIVAMTMHLSYAVGYFKKLVENERLGKFWDG